MQVEDPEAIARWLEQTGQFRVLRRYAPPTPIPYTASPETRLGIFLDVETTGLDVRKDEIIELAMVPFTYTLDGDVVGVHEAFHSYREPGVPIPSEITELTGITDDMVRGHAIDDDALQTFLAPAALVIAHNAAFDRRFVERLSSIFERKAWACSMSQIPWSEEGVRGSKLAYLAAAFGFFFDEHRATTDCQAAVEILSRPLPVSGSTAMAALLARARQRTCRVWAESSPYDLKERLKARRYRWSGGEDGTLRAWYIDVTEDTLEAELAFLHTEIYGRECDIPITYIDAFTRFSSRV